MRKILILALFAFIACSWAIPANAIDYTKVQATNAHDWTPDPRRDNPPCNNPVPCVGDLQGTNGADLLDASPGWDWLNAAGGPDLLYGGGGMDQLYGGDGQDNIYGQDSHDHLWGGDGDDNIRANDGAQDAGHIEEIWADQTSKGEFGYDRCWIDADPEGAVIRHCEVLHIWASAGYSGTTKVFASMQDKEANRYPKYFKPGTYYNVNRF